jgi:hypothetical protein
VTKTRFMIVSGASIGRVVDGKRVTIQPGGGDEFTDDEITTLNRLQPGVLRNPVNEGGQSKGGDDADETAVKPAKSKTAKAPKGKAATPKGDDADEDEDI